MAMNRTLLELELSSPAGTSGTAVTPRGRQLKPDTTTAVYKSRQQGTAGEAAMVLGEEAVNCNVVQREGIVCILLIRNFPSPSLWLGVPQMFSIPFISLAALIYSDARVERIRGKKVNSCVTPSSSGMPCCPLKSGQTC